MEVHLHALTEHQKFLREFITLYRQQQGLWDKNHPNYRNRSERQEAYEILLKKCKEYVPDADEDYVRLRIDSMRSTFRKEHKKVLKSRKTATSPSEVYKPSLWYYELLLFTAGEDMDEEALDTKEVTQEDGDSNYNVVKIPFWGREYSSMVIQMYQKHTALYSLEDPNYKCKQSRVNAIKAITEEMMNKTGKIFTPEDVRRKLHLLRGQFMYEYRKVLRSKRIKGYYKPTLWCYNSLMFLRPHVFKASKRTTIKEEDSNDANDEALEDCKDESDSTISSNQDHLEVEPPENQQKLNNTLDSSIVEGDIFDTIGKLVAHKLRDMTTEQNKIAQRLIHELMYHGQMENLTSASRLNIDGR